MPSILPPYTEGLKKTLGMHNATMPELYSWHAVAEDGTTIFITEADHANKNSSIVKLKDGYIQRNIDAIPNDKSSSTIRHAQDVFDAAKYAHENKESVMVLLTLYSRYSKTPKSKIKAMLLPWRYYVTEFSGESIKTGFSYRLEKL